MTGLFAGRSPLIGVDVDGRYLRVAQVAPAPGGWALQAAVRIPRVTPDEPLGPRDVAHLASTLGRLGFQGQRLVLAAPEQKLAVDILELPPRTSDAPVDAIAQTELARTHGYDPAAAETLCWDLPPSSRARDMTQVMAVALPHADADALLTVFDGSGLNVVAIDIPMAAIIRACRPLLAEEGLTVILNATWDWTLLVVLRQGMAVYRRLMPEHSVRALTQAIARNLDLQSESVDCLLENVGLAEGTALPGGVAVSLNSLRGLIRRPIHAVAEAVQAAFAYAGQMYAGATPGRVILTGQAAAVPGVAPYLGTRLGLDVVTATPRHLMASPPGADAVADDPSLTVAVGLSLFAEGRQRAKPQPHSVVQA